uniref:B30.2/SPRY domain-containing protein n=1 Tax=Plectus sambesii TaxID=2011161 RepID=A0A914VJY8_9BILA
MRLCNCIPFKPSTSSDCGSICPGVNVSFVNDDWSWNLECLPPYSKLSGPDNRTVIFNEIWSFGTAGIQGDKRLTRDTIAYWEVFVSHRVFGTALMFGIGAKQGYLYANDFCHMIGDNAHSWGLCHKGLLWHGSISVRFCEPFEEFKPTKIAMLFDGPAGTLRFWKDDQDLGIGFANMFEHHDGPFYPMVSSTAAKTEMTLGRRLQNTQRLRRLSDAAAISVLLNLTSRSAICDLPLPADSKRTLQQKWDDFRTSD